MTGIPIGTINSIKTWVFAFHNADTLRQIINLGHVEIDINHRLIPPLDSLRVPVFPFGQE